MQPKLCLFIKLVMRLPEPKFEWFRDKAGKFRFRLVAANGEKIAISPSYKTKEGVFDAIKSIMDYAPYARIEGPQIVRARFLMETMKPKILELLPNEAVKLEEGLIAKKTPRGKIELYVVG